MEKNGFYVKKVSDLNEVRDRTTNAVKRNLPMYPVKRNLPMHPVKRNLPICTQ